MLPSLLLCRGVVCERPFFALWLPEYGLFSAKITSVGDYHLTAFVAYLSIASFHPCDACISHCYSFCGSPGIRWARYALLWDSRITDVSAVIEPDVISPVEGNGRGGWLESKNQGMYERPLLRGLSSRGVYAPPEEALPLAEPAPKLPLAEPPAELDDPDPTQAATEPHTPPKHPLADAAALPSPLQLAEQLALAELPTPTEPQAAPEPPLPPLPPELDMYKLLSF